MKKFGLFVALALLNRPVLAETVKGWQPLCESSSNGECSTVTRVEDPGADFLIATEGAWDATVDVWYSCDAGKTRVTVSTFTNSRWTPEEASGPRGLQMPVSVCASPASRGACMVGATITDHTFGIVRLRVAVTGEGPYDLTPPEEK